jgi:hypothetical protein
MPKRLAWGVGVALLCLVIAAALRLGRRPSQDRRLLGAAPSAIVRLERTLGGDTLVLARKAGRWRVAGGGDADPELCRRLAEGAQQLAAGPAVSEDPSAYGTYGLSDAEAARLKVFAESSAAPALDVYFGKPAYGDALYARLAGEAPVFIETGVDPALLALPATSFALRP